MPPSQQEDMPKAKAARKIKVIVPKVHVSKSEKHFSLKQFLIFGLVFGAIGGYFIWHSFAASTVVAKVEAESMSLPPGAFVITDSSASGGQAVKLTQNGTATSSANFSSDATSLSLTARGDKCQGGWPKVSVTVDSTTILPNTTVASNSWQNYSADTSISSGSHNLSIILSNIPSPHNTCIRNLYLDVTVFYGSVPPPTVNLSANPPSVDPGQASTLIWTSANATSCTAFGDWSGSKPTSGSESTGPLNSSSTYKLDCAGPGGTGSASVTVTVNAAPPVPACTKYLSTNGTGNGSDTGHPASLSYAKSNASPGDVWCFMPGTYNVGSSAWYEMGSRGGTSSAWIVYRSYDLSNQAVIQESFTSGGGIFKVTGPGAGGHGYYIEFNSLIFDGRSHLYAYEGVGAGQGAHHIRYINLTVHDMSNSGLVGSNSDYLVAIGNKIWRTGPGQGNDNGGSTINFNQNCDDNGTCGNLHYPYDAAPGFHDIIVGNIVTGAYHLPNGNYTVGHQDGNGIIIDRGGNTVPPILIADNVIYMNGGRGIELLNIKNKVFIVNNTVYKDVLDLGMPTSDYYGDMITNVSTNTTYANNVVYTWTPRWSYANLSNGTFAYDHNSYYGGKGNYNVGSLSQSQMINIDPKFVNPPTVVEPPTDGQYLTSPTPSQLGNGLQLQSSSQLVNTGADPRTLAGLDSTMLSQINQYAMVDINNVARPQGSGFDYGAYEQ